MTFNKDFAICIPTFNRSKLLKKCIDSFIEDAMIYNVPIYISDNNSSDDTEKMIAKYKKLYPNIFYKKQPMNLGIDINMLFAVEMAQTKYALWLGDDDELMQNAIPTLLNNMSLNPNLIILNTVVDKKLRDYSNPYEFFIDHGMVGLHGGLHFSFLVVDVEAIRQLPSKNRYIGTLHLYAGVILDYLLNEYKVSSKIFVRAIPENIIKLGNSKKSWSNQFLEVFFIYIPNWFNLLEKEYRENKKIKEIFKEYNLTLNTCNWLPSYKLITILKSNLSQSDKRKLLKICFNKMGKDIIRYIKECIRRPRTIWTGLK